MIIFLILIICIAIIFNDLLAQSQCEISRLIYHPIFLRLCYCLNNLRLVLIMQLSDDTVLKIQGKTAKKAQKPDVKNLLRAIFVMRYLRNNRLC